MSRIVAIPQVEEGQLYPDEDFIAWEMARQSDGLSIRELIGEIDPADYREHWRDSLELNGNVCTPGVSPEKVLGHKIISSNNYKLLYAIGGDAIPTPLNYRFMGSHYRRCIEALFEHGEEAASKVASSYWTLGKAS